MQPALPENFLFVPTAGNAGVLHALQPAAEFANNSFVLIPYSNPQVKMPKPQFYSVTLTTVIPDFSVYKTGTAQRPLQLQARSSRQAYLKNVEALKQHIQLGNIYEVNYCIQFFSEQAEIDPIAVFLNLQAIAKAPYAALVKLGHEFILCASPELFLKKEKDQLFTKPIKGTAKRGATAEEDQILKHNLYNSLKERTENVMAVDVARNDLSQLATMGSVAVNKLYNIESFETVHQMVSTVSCTLKDGLSFQQILEATFPMASMTGAPKIRAMQLIGEYENFDRHYYSGAMGLVDARGDFTLSVNIRSIFYHAATKQLSIAVGGAITYLSEAGQEYEECLLKAQALLKALQATITP